MNLFYASVLSTPPIQAYGFARYVQYIRYPVRTVCMVYTLFYTHEAQLHSKLNLPVPLIWQKCDTHHARMQHAQKNMRQSHDSEFRRETYFLDVDSVPLLGLVVLTKPDQKYINESSTRGFFPAQGALEVAP